jgi:ribonuclease T
MSDNQPRMARRFRGFLPVVVDVETGGFNSRTDALLEIAAVLIDMDDDGQLYPGEPISSRRRWISPALIRPTHCAGLWPKSAR